MFLAAVFGALFSVWVHAGRPVVYYDEDEKGEKVCVRVETPDGQKPCATYNAKELEFMEWSPSLSRPE
jgi:hypothetical protein